MPPIHENSVATLKAKATTYLVVAAIDFIKEGETKSGLEKLRRCVETYLEAHSIKGE